MSALLMTEGLLPHEREKVAKPDEGRAASPSPGPALRSGPPSPASGRGISNTVYLQPGHLHASAEPTIVTTILGSCVAVCLWDETTGIGGLNHFMLPYHAGGAASARFGNVAFDELLSRLEALGANMRRLRAHVYGGSCMFPSMQRGEHLGHKNATVAFELLKAAGIPIIHSETGGLRGRKLIFDTASGLVTVKAV